MIPTTINVLADIRDERMRQVTVEGWTPEHDDKHRPGELAQAGAAYALHPLMHKVTGFDGSHSNLRDWLWPFKEPPKPKDRRRDLVRAAALIVAEIERLDRVDARWNWPAFAEKARRS